MSDLASDTVKVFDTWVTGKNGTLHFDVMTTDEETALRLAKEYVRNLGESEGLVTTKACRFCHSEPLVFFSAEQQRELKERGGFIVRMPV
ncbi:DUF2024 family protein [Candidatus Nitrospira bockiana]